MTATPSTTGSAERWGPLWGARAEDWDEVETQQLPTYEEAIRRAAIGSGRVLDIGCGSGAFLRAAADRGVEVFGFDASDSLIAVARERVPEADLRVGDMESLPYEDDSSTSSPASTPSSSPRAWSPRCARRGASPSPERPS